ncbi:tRNA aspartic acid methyltransferase 1 [Paragonimus heterotremus]|uniref:tRNA aspartic acid methyltransferase 1 n=1 Tax=Paragonimus heterotremus TaxID=100268 RepID=A0A8J4SKX1_9TREM|nr:tRNA aspartic acid methyltransferase 1 [Paragonimus heterotremus]
MRVLELYSGIGGIHCAFEKSTLDYKIVTAIDINDTATLVYRRNFPGTPALNRVLESLSMQELVSLKIDLWSMSPPCQPFTRLGNRKCEADKRTASFIHVLTLIASVQPSFLLLENVKGFEETEPWRQLLDVLNKCGYIYQQFLLTPLQFGIPNCRLRFYMVARKKSSPSELASQTRGHIFSRAKLTDGIHLVPPTDAPALPGCHCPTCLGMTRHITEPDENFSNYLPYCQPIANFIDVTASHLPKSIFLDNSCLERYFPILDIVRPCDRKTRCFTKGYSKRMEGTGSVLQSASLDLNAQQINSLWTSVKDDKESVLTLAQSLGLRFFNSQEVANLLCFPPGYSFPELVTEKQRIRLLGNSVNVMVMAHLIYWAFGDVCCSTKEHDPDSTETTV